MIPFNFDYARPDTLEQAVTLWQHCDQKGKHAVYYAGGTQIITLCREQKIKPDLVIDIKGIKECLTFREDDRLVYGAALPLNNIIDKTRVTLLSQTLGKIADHTIRNRLTLGGNIMGYLPFKEAVLAFLVLDGSAEIFGPQGWRTQSLSTLFNKRVRLEKGECIVNFSLSPETIKTKTFFVRKQKDSPVDYPILTACFAGRTKSLTMAVSGVFAFPLRDADIDIILNQTDLSCDKRALQAVDLLDPLFKSDFRASAAYRKHLLRLAILQGIKELET